ncbi:DUF5682 family protein [Roseimaritima ulvae]|uniref:4-aminobutyrate aminotransferase n=1 Tax=Roseimaritima ulvae TaxID=980254 RepID=A0A5B9QU36_9BACT|nr:DUF5682 family protein [Roseimaritima ulvae]QEG41469.1 hypothetical protein UC8_34910 [Roseimaritima ulvae]
MRDADVNKLVRRLCDTEADVVYFPVRHHSPACATLLGQWIDSLKPAAVLIEGPSDYNEHLAELTLDHQLPIAIYSYFRSVADPDSAALHHGVYYPFCEYSPEWIGLHRGLACDALVRFIDLPWAESYADDRTTHRYADAELRRGRYVQALCERLQVEDFDDLWDRLVESHQTLDLHDYLQRVHSLCLNTRIWEQPISVSDRRRESFMARQIDAVRQQTEGTVLVVTGGFHSSALAARLEARPCPGIDDPPPPDAASPETDASAPPASIVERGVALTTYSYERLDNLTGYNAGMPSPGFYEHAWQQRQAGESFDHQPLLIQLVAALRERNQTLSTADLIAVETSAQAFAALRGRGHVWRCDLIDAATSSLIKDELEYDCGSPFIDAVHEVLRGNRQGQLAAGTRVPPLVQEIRRQLDAFSLQPSRRPETVELDLSDEADLRKSRLLHQLQILDVQGFRRQAGTDFLTRENLQRLWESWQLRWTPEFESSCIEASRFGTKLEDAVASCLTAQAGQQQRDAAAAAELLVQAAQAGVESLSQSLLKSLSQLIAQEPRFVQASACLRHLLFLYCFDEALGTTRLPALQGLVRETFSRSLWLLESVGRQTTNDPGLLRGMQAIQETYRRVEDILDWDNADFTAVLARVQADRHKPPQLRGGAAGMLWGLGTATDDSVLADLLYFSDPDQLGDFLSGLFSLARELVQRHPQLVQSIDQVLLQYGAEDFQTALPALRLAFTSFTPREKHHMLATLFDSLGLTSIQPLSPLQVDEQTMLEATAIEDRIFEAIEKYGLEAADD